MYNHSVDLHSPVLTTESFNDACRYAAILTAHLLFIAIFLLVLVDGAMLQL